MAMRPQRGITLIEALLALAVMAFGIIGVVGMQVALRSTSDLSKQRAEAVRIAQASSETARSFSLIDPPAVADGTRDYQGIGTTGPDDVAGLSTNTTFLLSTTVADLFTAPDSLRAKEVTTSVNWLDRAGVEQGVVLRTVVGAEPPGVTGALAAPARDPVGNGSRGRHPLVPATAVDQTGQATSSFSPPGAGGVRWIFDNTTAFITAICTSSDPGSCTPASARLLSGFVRFATGTTQPTAQQAELPPSLAEAVQVIVDRTLPTPSATVDCFETVASTYVAYFCALPVTTDSSPRWSGRSRVGGLSLATSIASSSATLYRVCRYTPHRDHRAVGASPPMRNDEHPLDYLGVTTALTNQNFLVIRAGDGTVPFACPNDDTSTNFINGATWHHQPST